MVAESPEAGRCVRGAVSMNALRRVRKLEPKLRGGQLRFKYANANGYGETMSMHRQSSCGHENGTYKLMP
eukprot:13467386-Heterocapsa_arctica.AAC.1